SLRFLDVNETAIRHYGYSREEFLGMTIRDIRPPEDVPKIEMLVASLQPGDVYSGLARHQTKEGKILQAEIFARAVDLEGSLVCLVLAQDVTERIEAEKESRRTAELLRAVADVTSDALFVKDREG